MIGIQYTYAIIQYLKKHIHMTLRHYWFDGPLSVME